MTKSWKASLKAWVFPGLQEKRDLLCFRGQSQKTRTQNFCNSTIVSLKVSNSHTYICHFLNGQKILINIFIRKMYRWPISTRIDD